MPTNEDRIRKLRELRNAQQAARVALGDDIPIDRIIKLELILELIELRAAIEVLPTHLPAPRE